MSKIVMVLSGDCYLNPWSMQGTDTPTIAWAATRAEMFKALIGRGDTVTVLNNTNPQTLSAEQQVASQGDFPTLVTSTDSPNYQLSDPAKDALREADIVYLEKRWPYLSGHDRGYSRMWAVLSFMKDFPSKAVVLHDCDYQGRNQPMGLPSHIQEVEWCLNGDPQRKRLMLPEIHQWFNHPDADKHLKVRQIEGDYMVFVGNDYEKDTIDLNTNFVNVNPHLTHYIVGSWSTGPGTNREWLSGKGVKFLAKKTWQESMNLIKHSNLTCAVGRRVHYDLGCTQHRFYEGLLLGHSVVRVSPNYFDGKCGPFFAQYNVWQTQLPSRPAQDPCDAERFIREWNSL